MKLWLNIILLMMSGTISQANMKDYHQQGKSFAKTLKTTSPKNLNDVPHYQGKDIPEVQLKARDLAGAAQEKALQSTEVQFIEESLIKRPPFQFDPEKDPLFTTADEIVNDPEISLNVTAKETSEEPKKTIHTCVEEKEEIQLSCTSDLIVEKVGTKEEMKTFVVMVRVGTILQHEDPLVRDMLYDTNLKYMLGTFYKKRRYRKIQYRRLSSTEMTTSFKKVYGGTEFSKENIRHVKLIGLTGNSYRLKKHFKPSEFTQFEVQAMVHSSELKTSWRSTCADLEQLVDEGKCEYGGKKCTQGLETRTIDGVPVTESCWQEQRIYSCQGEVKDTCTTLRQQGCYQIASRCLRENEGECEEWEQTLECASNQNLTVSSLEGDKPFCLDGDCVDQGWAPNQDMADSLSKLAIFQHIQKDMDAKAQTVFKGKDLKCSRAITNFKDCCVKKGWGMSVGLAGCDGEEKELAEQRKLDKCIRVGTYCAEKVLGKCVRKKTSYCCFGSKLARIIHEQGRKQLGLKFGSGKHPKCQGLTLDQLTKIDFSKIDLSELFKDLAAKIKPPVMSKITQGIQQSFQDKKPVEGRSHGQF